MSRKERLLLPRAALLAEREEDSSWTIKSGSACSSGRGGGSGSARAAAASHPLLSSGCALPLACFVAGALAMLGLALVSGTVQWEQVVLPRAGRLLPRLEGWRWSGHGQASQAAPVSSSFAALAADKPLLTAADVARGMTYYGTGTSLRRVAQKLLAGQPITAFTLGGSVTRGQGAHDPLNCYAHRFFQFINASWPHSGHVLENKGIGGTSSGIFSACAEQMVAEGADLVVLEFTVNDSDDLPLPHPQRLGYEQLVRKLLRLPGAPALLQLHHYTWWRAVGDGVDRGLFYYPRAEEQLTLLSHYYDIPSLSVRAALYPLMLAGIPGFQVDKVWQKHKVSPTGIKLPAAAEEERGDYFYNDRTHPNDRGHQMLAELLAGALLRAVEEVQQRGAAAAPGTWAQRPQEAELLSTLPPPMIPGNVDVPTTLCAIQEGFKPLVAAAKGFEYRAERPEEKSFVAQKWGWTGTQPGAWAELQFDSRPGTSAKNAAGSSFGASAVGSSGAPAEVLIAHLKSYEGMGTAKVECVAGCACKSSTLDGTWEQQASLMQMHKVKVSPHARCRMRVTIRREAGAVRQQGHKVSLMALMVSQFPIRLDGYDTQPERVAKLVAL